MRERKKYTIENKGKYVTEENKFQRCMYHQHEI